MHTCTERVKCGGGRIKGTARTRLLGAGNDRAELGVRLQVPRLDLPELFGEVGGHLRHMGRERAQEERGRVHVQRHGPLGRRHFLVQGVQARLYK
jgi:hypothetical protein